MISSRRVMACAVAAALSGCAGPEPSGPHVCSEAPDARIVFAYEATDPSLDATMTALGADFLFVTADCRYYVRLRGAEGTWTPTAEGRLTDAHLHSLNEAFMVRDWPGSANTNELVPPVWFDAGYRSLRRGSYRHYCNDGCPDDLPRVEQFMRDLTLVGVPLTTPIVVFGTRGFTGLAGPPVGVDLSSDAMNWEVAEAVVVEGSDAAALRGARDVMRARGTLRELEGVPIEDDGVVWTVWFRETIEIESPLAVLPQPLDPE